VTGDVPEVAVLGIVSVKAPIKVLPGTL